MPHDYSGGASKLTPEGGQAIVMFNRSGAAVSSGTLVQVSISGPSSFTTAPAGCLYPLGVAYETVGDGELCWVVRDGTTMVQLQTGTGCAPGQVLVPSPTEPGRVVGGGIGPVVGRALQGAATTPGVSYSVLALIAIEGVGSTALGMGSQALTRTLHVVAGSPVGGDGSASAPFATIQAAVDAAALLTPAPSGLNPVKIDIGPGSYAENVVVRLDGIYLIGAAHDLTFIEAATGSALTVTNSTAAGLAAYNASGNYAHLVNMGSAGPRSFGVKDVLLRTLAAGATTFRLLGVAGDAGVGLTDFLDANLATSNTGFGMETCFIQYSGVGSKSFYMRNVNYFAFESTFWMGNWDIVNCSYVDLAKSSCGYGSATYVAADPRGQPSWGPGFIQLMNHAMTGADLTISGEVEVDVYNTSVDDTIVSDSAKLYMQSGVMDSLDANGTATVSLEHVLIDTTLDAEGGVALTLLDVSVTGATTILAGAGAVVVGDVAFNGGLTDAGNKVDRTVTRRRIKTGTATGGGAGDVAVAFAVAFPDANYRIALGNVGAAAAVVKAASKAAGGFTLTFGAAGDCDWTATHD